MANLDARRANVSVKYQGVDISADIAKDLLSFTYTDNASGTADDISITIKDNHKKWLMNWFPEKGDIVAAEIRTINWKSDGDKGKLPCGTFMVDEPEYSGRPSTLTIKAISIPANSNFLTTPRNKVWREISLKKIGEEISKRYGLKFFFDSTNNPFYKSQEQTDKSDSAFLVELCENEGLAYKVSDNQIIIFDEEKYEKRKSVATFIESSSTVTGYRLVSSYTNTAYAGCNVKYYDANKGKQIAFLFAVKDDIDPEKDKVYQLNSRVKSEGEARRLAQKTLRKLNKKENRVSLDVVGDTRIVGGCCVDLREFGPFDGKYYVEKATQSIGDGYKTSMELRKVLEGY